MARCSSDLKSALGIPDLVFEAMKVLLKATAFIDKCTIYEPKVMRDKGFEYFLSGQQL